MTTNEFIKGFRFESEAKGLLMPWDYPTLHFYAVEAENGSPDHFPSMDLPCKITKRSEQLLKNYLLRQDLEEFFGFPLRWFDFKILQEPMLVGEEEAYYASLSLKPSVMWAIRK